MNQLEKLTSDYNELAAAHGFAGRDKRFRSYQKAIEDMEQLKESVKNKKLNAMLAEENAIRAAVSETGWSEELVKALSKDERNSVMALTRLVVAHDEELSKFVAEVERDVAYAIQWSESIVVKSHKVKIAKEILQGFESQAYQDDPVTYREFVKKYRESLKDQLLSNYFRGGSTSAFNNAVEGAQREAVSQMLGSFFGGFGWLEFEEE